MELNSLLRTSWIIFETSHQVSDCTHVNNELHDGDGTHAKKIILYVVGQLVILLMSMIPLTKSYYTTAKHVYTDAICHRGPLSALIGGFLLGAGMAIAGAVSTDCL